MRKIKSLGDEVRNRLKNHLYRKMINTQHAVYKHKVETMEKFGDPHQIDWEGSKLLHVNKIGTIEWLLNILL